MQQEKVDLSDHRKSHVSGAPYLTQQPHVSAVLGLAVYLLRSGGAVNLYRMIYLEQEPALYGFPVCHARLVLVYPVNR